MEAIDERIAVISDVHGNSLALSSVLDDIDSRGIERILNLGDSLYGPLDPAGTADMLLSRKITSVRGNEDRILVRSCGTDGGVSSRETANLSLRFTRSNLTIEHMNWLSSLPTDLHLDPGLYLCHASPGDDTEYLLWEIGELGARRRSDGEILSMLGEITSPVVLCGHDHLQANDLLPDGRLVVNPGSVGLPAYMDDLPHPHVMEAGSPHACYSILHRNGGKWEVEHRSVDYDWESASRMAAENDRSDWVNWLLTGRTGKSNT